MGFRVWGLGLGVLKVQGSEFSLSRAEGGGGVGASLGCSDPLPLGACAMDCQSSSKKKLRSPLNPKPLNPKPETLNALG